ncbi:MAG TPA: hypothetical protein VFO40_11540 [Chthoniobacterales bacterium]|nr:hypothetical protein [Chthoniobacterales bacterium]
MMGSQIIDLDGAWPAGTAAIPQILNCRNWGPQLRYCAPARIVNAFWEEIGTKTTPFTLYGSGDFHHLTALWIRQVREPFILVSFDNHPDWDTRPPAWCCGTWMNRALESAPISRAAIWGCANFELNPPHRWFANHVSLRSGRLEVWPWIERFGKSARRRWTGMNAENWRSKFTQFVHTLKGRHVYITVDFDCLTPNDAITDWEQGLFTVDDLVWAIARIRLESLVVGGDICGAHSPASYARWTQRSTAQMDHPKKLRPDPLFAFERNRNAVEQVWPVLIGSEA